MLIFSNISQLLLSLFFYFLYHIESYFHFCHFALINLSTLEYLTRYIHSILLSFKPLFINSLSKILYFIHLKLFLLIRPLVYLSQFRHPVPLYYVFEFLQSCLVELVGIWNVLSHRFNMQILYRFI